ncbi:MAG: 3-phosphoserine/phosphohydroxythreonine transaminase, partial [Planctomycetaceae bacterium]
RWLRDEVGGLAEMAAIHQQKSQRLASVFDNRPEFWRLHAAPTARSLRNLAMRLPTPELESQFLRDAQAAGFSGLKGHRSVG